MSISAACRGTGWPAWKANSSSRRSRRQRLWWRPTFRRNPTTYRPRSAIGARRRCGSISSRSNSRPARRRHDVRLLDLQRKGAGPVPARSRRRHGRCSSEKCRGQLDAPLGRLPCGHRTRRRRGLHPDQSGRGEVDSRSRRLSPGCLSITARRRWSPIILPTACTE